MTLDAARLERMQSRVTHARERPLGLNTAHFDRFYGEDVYLLLAERAELLAEIERLKAGSAAEPARKAAPAPQPARHGARSVPSV